jgi:hypothetical protein
MKFPAYDYFKKEDTHVVCISVFQVGHYISKRSAFIWGQQLQTNGTAPMMTVDQLKFWG